MEPELKGTCVFADSIRGSAIDRQPSDVRDNHRDRARDRDTQS
jgi:hypothetical protein